MGETLKENQKKFADAERRLAKARKAAEQREADARAKAWDTNE